MVNSLKEFASTMRIQALLLLLMCHVAYGQEKVFGDTTVMRNIRAFTSTIYDLKDTTYFFLTKEKFFDNALAGTNIVAYEFKNSINRIVAFTTKNEGLLSAEYYYLNDTVLMIYESFEYYSEASPAKQEKNFKGLPFWESRFFLANGKLADTNTWAEVLKATIMLLKKSMMEIKYLNM